MLEVLSRVRWPCCVKYDLLLLVLAGTTLFVDSLGITSTHDGEDDGLAIFVFAGAGMMVTALVLLLMPKLPIKDTDKPVPFCCASKKHVGARELADPLLDSDNQE